MLQVVTWNFTSVMWRISHLVWEHEQANVQFPLLGNLMKSLSNKFGCLAIDFTELGPKVQALACPGIFFLWGGDLFAREGFKRPLQGVQGDGSPPDGMQI